MQCLTDLGALHPTARLVPPIAIITVRSCPLQFDTDRARYHLKKAKMDQASLAIILSDKSPVFTAAAGDVFRKLASNIGLDLQHMRGVAHNKMADLSLSLCYGRVTEDWMFSAGSPAGPCGGFRRLPSAAVCAVANGCPLGNGQRETGGLLCRNATDCPQ